LPAEFLAAAYHTSVTPLVLTEIWSTKALYWPPPFNRFNVLPSPVGIQRMSNASKFQPPFGYPEILAHMGVIIFCELTESGIDEGHAAALSMRAVEGVRKQFGGIQHYIPIAIDVDLSKRNEVIFSEFTGYNYDELAQKYGLSSMSIRNIVKRAQKIERMKRSIAD
jgi:Mor family transcriptional regulator